MKKVFIIFHLFLFLSGYTQTVKPRYEVIDGAIVGHNVGYNNNRPLYINNSNAFILTGDQPVVRLVKGEYIYGRLLCLALKGTEWENGSINATIFHHFTRQVECRGKLPMKSFPV